MDTIQVPGTLESLAMIRNFVRAAAEQAGIDRKQAYKLQLAVDEIATNIVNYGYGWSGTQGDIILSAQIDPRSLSITLQDSSPPFDPLSRSRPDHLDKNLEERPHGGLGIFLAQENVDEYRYEFRNGCNNNIFIVNRPSV
jgi:serine/threonine-protein kinase RsbW